MNALLTPAQYYALNWIGEHGEFEYPHHPDGWRHLSVPPEHRKGFSVRTLRLLTTAGYLEKTHTLSERPIYAITPKGRHILTQYEDTNPDLLSIDWYAQRLAGLANRLSEKDRARLRKAVKSLYDEFSGGRL